MSNLEELGGLEACKSLAAWLNLSDHQIGSEQVKALIEQVNDLTAERDELKNRVTELERERDCPPFDPNDLPISLEMNEDGSVSQVLETVGGEKVEPFMERIKVMEAQLQAASALAESVKLHHRDQSSPYDVPFEKCPDMLCIQARALLKMLEEPHAA